MLYIVSTPIGNLQDITLRAIEALKNCDFIIAENPRNSAKLLNNYGIAGKPVHQFAEHNEQKVLGKLIEMLKEKNGCLITDAGTPGISDPGFRLVRECIKENIQVVSLPGPSAAITALAASGLPTDRFIFVGFMPRTENKTVKLITLGKDSEATLIAYDSPFRIKKTLEIISKNFPDAKVVVAREISKVFEEYLRGSAAEIVSVIGNKAIKGEITLLVAFK
ncbi:MAG TPA: 16S rRNA (cytidine(1402)-2'-O)-methyltransferase [Verrucomicrobiae bacterium]|nr:16S rRNA (cytidine(1402)-2'-O)-methyltransferase [Verrucomicrobiae bacterium]